MLTMKHLENNIKQLLFMLYKLFFSVADLKNLNNNQFKFSKHPFASIYSIIQKPPLHTVQFCVYLKHRDLALLSFEAIEETWFFFLVF